MQNSNIISKKNLSSPITGNSTEVLLKLNKYPVTEIYQKFGENNFPNPSQFDQELRYCKKSNHAFLGKLLPQEFIYSPDNYNTITSASQGSSVAIEHFYKYVESYLKKRNVEVFIDIGANDNLMLKKFKKSGAKLIGIDPNIISDDEEILCINDYFENVQIFKEFKSGRVFLCSHTLEHIYDPRSFMEILRKNSQKDDLYFFQFPCLDLLLKDLRFDQIHHQHIHYFSVQSFKMLIEDFGFELLDYSFDFDHYGTLRTCFRKRTSSGSININDFVQIKNFQKDYDCFLKILSSANDRIDAIRDDFYCFGASLMLPILSYYLPSLKGAKNIIDENPDKLGLSYVNFDIEIVNSSTINYVNSNFIITAVATKLATRGVLNKLSNLKAMNIILPLNTI